MKATTPKIRPNGKLAQGWSVAPEFCDGARLEEQRKREVAWIVGGAPDQTARMPKEVSRA